MHEHPQNGRSLATLSPEERSRALERYRILQPCTEDGVPLTHVARHQGTPLRTLQLWLAQYRRHGLAWLTVIMDDYSRAIAGFSVNVEAPSTIQTALTLRQAIWRKSLPHWKILGIPATFYSDHGSDFT